MRRARIVAAVAALLMAVATPAWASHLVYFRTGVVECQYNQGLGTKVYAREDHYHYKSGQGIEGLLPGDNVWWVSRLTPTGGPVQTWKVGNRPPFNHSYWGSYGYCGAVG